MISLRKIKDPSVTASGNYLATDEGWVLVELARGTKTVFLKSSWEAVPPVYVACSVRLEDNAAVRILQVSDIRVAFPKDILITWVGDGMVKFQREVSR